MISPNPEGNLPGGEIPSHLITEDGTGDVYMLHGGEVDLRLYEGMHVTIYGPFQTHGNPLPPDATRVPIWVTSLEALNTPTPAPKVERVTVTFELTLDTEVSEGRSLGLGYGPIYNTPADFKSVGFCSNDPQDAGDLPSCVAGETYSGTLEVPAGTPFSFDYLVEANYDYVRCDFMGPLQVVYSDTQTFTEATTISATYVEEPLPEGCRAVGAETEEVASAQYEDGSAASDDTTSDNPVLGVLPDTGGFPLVTLGLVGLLLLSGGGLLAYSFIRR